VPFLEPSGQALIVYGLVQINDRFVGERNPAGLEGVEPPATGRGYGSTADPSA
jgi:hypothetical protein